MLPHPLSPNVDLDYRLVAITQPDGESRKEAWTDKEAVRSPNTKKRDSYFIGRACCSTRHAVAHRKTRYDHPLNLNLAL